MWCQSGSRCIPTVGGVTLGALPARMAGRWGVARLAVVVAGVIEGVHQPVDGAGVAAGTFAGPVLRLGVTGCATVQNQVNEVPVIRGVAG